MSYETSANAGSELGAGFGFVVAGLLQEEAEGAHSYGCDKWSKTCPEPLKFLVQVHLMHLRLVKAGEACVKTNGIRLCELQRTTVPTLYCVSF